MKNPETGTQKSTLVSKNITVRGKRTSVRLEPEMWAALKDIARRENCKTHDLCSLIQLRKKEGTSLTAAIRVFLMLYYRASSTEMGHSRAGHGCFESMMQRAKTSYAVLRNRKTGLPAHKNGAVARNAGDVKDRNAKPHTRPAEGNIKRDISSKVDRVFYMTGGLSDVVQQSIAAP